MLSLWQRRHTGVTKHAPMWRDLTGSMLLDMADHQGQPSWGVEHTDWLVLLPASTLLIAPGGDH